MKETETETVDVPGLREQIEQALKKITPGEWAALIPKEGYRLLYPPHVKRIDTDEQGRRRHSFIATCEGVGCNNDADAHLIANAARWLRALLAALDQQAGEIEKHWRERAEKAEQEIATLKDQIALEKARTEEADRAHAVAHERALTAEASVQAAKAEALEEAAAHILDDANVDEREKTIANWLRTRAAGHRSGGQ